MEGSSNDEEEPKICTVFSTAPSGSKNAFDTIAFSMPKKESSASPSTASFFENKTEEMLSPSSKLFEEKGPPPLPPPIQDEPEEEEGLFESTLPFDINVSVQSLAAEAATVKQKVIDIFAEAESESKNVTEALENLVIQEDSHIQQIQGELIGQGDESIGVDIFQSMEQTSNEEVVQIESPILTATSLFADTPEVVFPVGQFSQPENTESSLFFNQVSSPVSIQQPLEFLRPQIIDTPFVPVIHSQSSTKQIRQANPVGPITASNFNSSTYSPVDLAYDAWIPKEETRKILSTIAASVHSGTYFPDKLHMTTPGIVYEDDLIDKVGVNMARIFGEAEASKRRILTADSVTQDDNGLRELIKLGCYRSAINLTKRLLTLYGQGPGKVGQFNKHNPHTLQLWFTRISLVVRIREFSIAESEIDAFKEFDNPDLYYEYYPDSYGKGRKGSMVPFNFRLLAAEILQYSKKSNEAIDRLTRILKTTQQIISNVENGLAEDGSISSMDDETKTKSLEIWRKREIRVYYSLANASLFSKDYSNTFKYLSTLCEKDKEKEPQIRSAIGRLFLQLGDLNTASLYFQSAADQRQGDSDSEQVENLVDSALNSIAHESYPEAFALLQQALLIQPDNFMITNNMSVCLLYMGKVKDSLSLMETTVKNNTPELLQENVLLNLCTIYELENTDGHKKNALLKLISEYKGDGINLASLKMPNLI